MANRQTPGEFEFIQRFLAPLAGEGGFSLNDDAAELTASGGWIVTTDMLIAGRHFLSDDPLDSVARKALRASLSDLAAKGAPPVHYLLSLALPGNFTEDGMAALASGLQADQARYGVTLLGGDTTATQGPLTLSITALGARPEGGMVRRSGARAGDALYVTGEIGEAWLGLQSLTGNLPGAWPEQAAAYRTPEPPVSLAARLPDFASAALDVSDGLLADAAHIADQSGVRLSLDLTQMPVSDAASRWIAAQDDADAARLSLATGGDDYQILFAAPDAHADLIQFASVETGIRITRIGAVEAGEGLGVTGERGALSPEKLGFTHF